VNNPKKRISYPAKALVSIVLILGLCGRNALAQTEAPGAKASGEVYQTLYLTNLTQENDANSLVTDLRNMLPQAKLFYVPSQGAISLRASAEDIALAQKILADLDKTKKIYRLTYTMTERDGARIIGVQHFAIIVASGSKTDFKQGSRVPIATGSRNSTSGGPDTELTYIDVGQEIEATLDSYLDGVRLRTRVVQSSIAEDKPGLGTPAPVIRQTTLEGTSTLVQGKPLVLGSVDVPGSTRHQEVEVVSELVR
jgi:type II secretory pathway component GspD/PulD (secretin)